MPGRAPAAGIAWLTARLKGLHIVPPLKVKLLLV